MLNRPGFQSDRSPSTFTAFCNCIAAAADSVAGISIASDSCGSSWTVQTAWPAASVPRPGPSQVSTIRVRWNGGIGPNVAAWPAGFQYAGNLPPAQRPRHRLGPQVQDVDRHLGPHPPVLRRRQPHRFGPRLHLPRLAQERLPCDAIAEPLEIVAADALKGHPHLFGHQPHARVPQPLVQLHLPVEALDVLPPERQASRQRHEALGEHLVHVRPPVLAQQVQVLALLQPAPQPLQPDRRHGLRRPPRRARVEQPAVTGGPRLIDRDLLRLRPVPLVRPGPAHRPGAATPPRRLPPDRCRQPPGSATD